MKSFQENSLQSSRVCLGRKDRNIAKNISENTLRLAKEHRGIYNKFLGDISCKNKRKVMKPGKALKYELL